MKSLLKAQCSIPVIGTLCISLLVFLSSCDQKPSGLAADPDINAIFNETEINDLSTILDFFEQQICDLSQIHPDSVQDCYRKFFTDVSTAQGTGIIYVPVPFHLQLDMYKKLSDGAFKEIWIAGTTIDQVTGDTTQRLMLSVDGKYMQFLGALRRDYSILDSYLRSLQAERKISSVMIESLLFNFSQFNMKDIRMRLFVALHYLTLNDTYERKNE